MTNTVHIPSQHKKTLLEIIHQQLPAIEVLVYGSRINGRSHDGSDLDIALRTPTQTPISPESMGAIRDAIEASSIPFLVDIRDWAVLPESFHREIEKAHVGI